MKPSERIHAMAQEILDDVQRRASPANFEVHRHEYANAALARAVVQYLDGEHEQRIEVAKLARVFAHVHVGDGDELGEAARALVQLLGSESGAPPCSACRGKFDPMTGCGYCKGSGRDSLAPDAKAAVPP